MLLPRKSRKTRSIALFSILFTTTSVFTSFEKTSSLVVLASSPEHHGAHDVDEKNGNNDGIAEATVFEQKDDSKNDDELCDDGDRSIMGDKTNTDIPTDDNDARDQNLNQDDVIEETTTFTHNEEKEERDTTEDENEYRNLDETENHDLPGDDETKASISTSTTAEKQHQGKERGHWGTPFPSDQDNVQDQEQKLHQQHQQKVHQQQQKQQHVPFIPIKQQQKQQEQGQRNGKPSSKTHIGEEKDILNDLSAEKDDIKITTGTNNQQSSSTLSHIPPEGFTLTAHIVTNLQDGHSYFTTTAPEKDDDGDHNTTNTSTSDNNNNNHHHQHNEELLIPFQECGAVGSTTQGISLNKAYFRHFPKSAHPAHFTPAQEPHLIICLNTLEIVVSGNNSERRTFDRGSVILVEDLLGQGHKLYSEDGDVSVLMLTLPPPSSSTHHHHYYHHQQHHQKEEDLQNRQNNGTRKGRVLSLFGLKKQQQNKKISDPLPCQVPDNLHDPAYSALGVRGPDEDEVSLFQMIRDVPKRRIALASIGLSVSTGLTYFLSKVAPLQLAVGMGGACVLGGGTWGTVKGGEKICDEIEMWMEKRRLIGFGAGGSSDTKQEGEDKEEEVVVVGEETFSASL